MLPVDHHLDCATNRFHDCMILAYSSVDIVPVEIGQLTGLQHLSLSNNSLNGSISYQVSHLQKECYLDLGWNYFTDLD
ncbi:hypothetical protein SLEP1_g54095 [Rubroshorea leprosula]|uniref:Uncharacterized protein n=1 Tax=Rubroshorea leprosula TaxID=152421 RepID=A0AAV5MBI8_9ROSI|nr:hypothetical protein SLEP1_g54095 [Rubroshorea leprosula]